MKKIGLLFATVVMIVLFAFSANALEPTGQCGENVYWSFDETTGELIISGEGDMYDYISEESPFYKSNATTLIIQDGITSIGDFSFEANDKITDIDFGNSIEVIGQNAFRGCFNLTEIVIPDSTTTIGYLSFVFCDKLTTVTLGKNVTVIDEGAFELCGNLTNINIPDSVTTIGKDAFYECISLHEIVLGANLSVIGDSSFYGSGIKKIEIPSSVKFIDLYAFENCKSLEEVIIGSIENDSSVCETVIARSAFTGCTNLKSLIIGSNVSSIGSSAFSGTTNLKSVKLPDNISYLDIGAFSYSGLTNISLPSSLKIIKRDMFYSCRLLEKVYIPVGITSIEQSVFNLTSLGDVYYEGTQEQWNNIDVDYDSNYTLSDASIHFNHKHKYSADIIIVSPSHLAEGSAIYICECGDNYKASVPKSEKHNYTSLITNPATHLTEGIETFTCECGDSYTEIIEKLSAHTYKEVITTPSCTAKGYTTYICECGDSYIDNYISETGHNDNNNDGICDGCDIKLETEDNDVSCSCNCHKSGIIGFIWKIINFFYKIFGINKTCGCGVAHY